MILLQLNEGKLKRRMALANYDSYDAIAEAARDRGKKLSARTIYNMLSGENWSRDKLETLCLVLNCQPADLVSGWESNGDGDDSHTHGAPQPEKEFQTATL